MFRELSYPGLDRFRRDSSGNIITLFALMSPVLLMAIAICVDYSHALTVRGQVQAALDSAVLAGEKAIVTQDKTASLRVANSFFHANADPIVPNATAEFSFDSGGALTGKVSFELHSFFGGVTGSSNMGQSLTSSASMGGSKATAANVCVLLLSGSKEGSLQVGAEAHVNAPHCEIDVASQAQFGAVFDAGSSLNVSRLCMAGADYFQNGGDERNLSINCPTPSNPYSGKLPKPNATACTVAPPKGGVYTGAVTLSPGVYCGSHVFAAGANVTFKPGLYVIRDGGWSVSGGQWQGANVTFYFADSPGIQFEAPMSLALSAPTSGPYAGILFQEADGLAPSAFAVDDSAGEALSGLIYLPSRAVSFTSPKSATSPNIALIADSLSLTQANWSLSPNKQWPIVNDNVGTPVEEEASASPATARPGLTQ